MALKIGIPGIGYVKLGRDSAENAGQSNAQPNIEEMLAKKTQYDPGLHMPEANKSSDELKPEGKRNPRTEQYRALMDGNPDLASLLQRAAVKLQTGYTEPLSKSEGQDKIR